ncbi:Ger(x)C family spore germination protein [Paenibacillus sp. BR2-3]|uniref:Ger(x)C family spore germination protein n=1 Tax=Paenibacillus sp. BR2-3 TaxID=3048494 RepID=UPI003977A7B0
MTTLKRICAAFLMLSISLLLLTSCLSYRDLDHVVFVTSILIDKDEDDNMVFYFETLNAIRSSSKGANQEKRIVYKITNKNAADAINSLEARTSVPISLAHNKVILFTEKFSRSGLDLVFDLFDRWQESVNRTLLCIYDGDPKDFIKPTNQEENMTGLYLYSMLGNKKSVTSYGVKINIKEFMNQKYIGDKVNSLPIITVSKDEDTKGQYYINGVGLVKEYKMVGRLDKEQTYYFNLLLNNQVDGNINTANPEDETKLVSMLLLKNNYDSDLELENNDLNVTIKLRLNTVISSIQGELELTKANIGKLQDSMAETIEENCLKLFQEWKDKKIDVFDIQEKFDRKYPSEAGRNIIEDSKLRMDVQVEINGTSSVRDAE